MHVRRVSDIGGYISLMYKGKTRSFSQSELVSSIFLPFGMSKHFFTRLLVLIFLVLNRCLSIPIPSKPNPCKIKSILNPPDAYKIDSILNPSPSHDIPSDTQSHDTHAPLDPRKSPSPLGHNSQYASDPGQGPSSSRGHLNDPPVLIAPTPIHKNGRLGEGGLD
jgi:hypothetical protein